MLVGVPTSGKSTWIPKQSFDWSRTVIASTDSYVERIASERGTTCNNVFKDIMPAAVNHMAETVIDAVKNNHDIVWDQTSTTRWTREKKFRMLPDNYEVIAVVFPTPSPEELDRRNNERGGKVIPQEVIESMISNYEEPTESEGFSKIIHVR
jgi:predicted kinase